MGATGIAVQRVTNDKASFGSGGILPVETARTFIRNVRNTVPTLRLVKEVPMTSPTMRFPKLATNGRILRVGTEGVAPRDQRPFSTSYVELTPRKLEAAYELTYELMRDNVEGQGVVTSLGQEAEAQVGDDLNYALWNGDTTDYSSAATTLSGSHTSSVTTITVVSTSGFPSASGEFGFLVIESERVEYTGVTSTTFTGATRGADATTAASHSSGVAVTFVQDALLPAFDGVRSLITTAGQVADLSVVGDGTLSFDTFETLLRLVPSKYRNSNRWRNDYRWSASDETMRLWARYIAARQTGGGDAALVMQSPAVLKPLGYEWNIDEALPAGTIVFGPPGMIYLGVRVDNIRRVSTNEGKDLKSRDVTYFKWSLDADVALEEEEAFAMGTGLVTSIG